MKRLTRDRVIGAMAAGNEPALRVAAGESFCLETEDCYGGRIAGPDGAAAPGASEFGNPATGPVYVEGARPGDVLRVEIEQIRTRDYAIMRIEPGRGALGRQVSEPETVVLPIRGGRLIVREGLELLLRPMIGVIGTAPAGEPVPTVTPGEHGGNLDCKEIGTGASVYLPVNAPGGLLALGDIHAVMGDGEVAICGAEVSGEVVLRAHVLRTDLPTPCVETAEHVSFLGSALTLDECEPMVLGKAHRYLTGMLGLSANEAARLMSLAGELRVCQVVDPLKTMKFTLPVAVLRAYGFGERAA